MKLPREVSGLELAAALRKLGYEVTRQSGSHIRLTTTREGGHGVTVPAHKILRVGTLSAILRDVAQHFTMGRDALLDLLFDGPP